MSGAPLFRRIELSDEYELRNSVVDLRPHRKNATLTVVLSALWTIVIVAFAVVALFVVVAP